MFHTLVCYIIRIDIAFVLAPSTGCFVWLSTVYCFDERKKKRESNSKWFLWNILYLHFCFHLTQFLLVLSKLTRNCHAYIAIEFGHPAASARLHTGITRPGLLEAWSVLTSVKYHGTLYILIPLNQRLALTRLRATGPRVKRGKLSWIRSVNNTSCQCVSQFNFERLLTQADKGTLYTFAHDGQTQVTKLATFVASLSR